LFFEYEEQYMSLTSILAGYKIYHQRKIQCYHYLDSAKSTTRQENDPVRPSKIFDNKKREKEEFINYIYSLGEEKLEEYRRLTGVDYINRKLEERAITRTVPPTIPVDWELPQPPEPAKDEEKNEP
jgi:hypothetical protein